MKKILGYLYIFSKLSTSFILLFCILLFGYFFYTSFNNQEKSESDQEKFANKLNENSNQLSLLSKKIQTTDSSLNEIIKIIKNNNETESKEIILLKKRIANFSSELESVLINLQKIKSLNLPNINNEIIDNGSNLIIDKNKLELVKLINYKFENSLVFDEELIILKNLNDENKQHIFEKINLVSSQNYRGGVFLKKIFSQEIDFFLKTNVNVISNNIIYSSIMKFILIEPSKKNIIKNNEVNYLNEINS